MRYCSTHNLKSLTTPALAAIALAIGTTTCAAHSVWQRTLYVGRHDNRIVTEDPASAFSPQGELFCSIGSAIDGGSVVRVWKIATGALLHKIDVKQFVNAIAVSPDSKSLAIVTGSGGMDENHQPVLDGGRVQTWSLLTGRRVRTFVPAGRIRAVFYSVAFSPDGKTLAAGAGDTLVRVWDVKTGRLWAQLKHGDFPNVLTFSPDGTLLVSGGGQQQSVVRFWKWPSARLWHTINQQRGNTHAQEQTDCVRFSPDGKWLLIHDAQSGQHSLYEVKSGKQINLTLETSNLYSDNTPMGVITPSNRFLFRVLEEGVIKQDVKTKKVKQTWPYGSNYGFPRNRVIALFLHHRQLYYALETYTGDRDYTIRLRRVDLAGPL